MSCAVLPYYQIKEHFEKNLLFSGDEWRGVIKCQKKNI